MVDSICIFEGIHYERLLPLVHFRPIYDLRCGISTLREKIQRAYPKVPATLHCRGYLSDVVRQQNPGVKVNELEGSSCLFVNGRVVADDRFAKKIPLKGVDTLYVSGETIVAARASGPKLRMLSAALTDVFNFSDFTGFVREEIDVKAIGYPWNLVGLNGDEIVNDFNALVGKKRGPKIKGKVYKGAVLLNPRSIFIDAGAKIKPGAVLDAEGGPIYIGKNVTVFPNATIEGPAYIGDGTLIKIGAKIYEHTSIGPMCKVGGEVEASIIHSYSNKQHDGFLGHAYLAMWVNLGADTNNSDLKNNYGSVKVYINGEMVDTGSMFVGLTMGDHSKSAVNTMFNTGTVVGVSSNVFGADFPPKYIPSFSWGGPGSMTTYNLEQSIDVAKRVMARRKVEMTPADEELFRKVFQFTQEERSKLGMPPA